MKFRSICAAVAATLVLPAAASAQNITLKYLTAWDNRYEGTPMIAYQYGDMLKEASKGRIKTVFSGPEVIKPNQQFQPTAAGVFDLNLSVAPYYLGTTGVPMAFFAMPASSERWREKGYWQFADKEMQRYGLKMISHVMGGTDANIFQVMLKEPVKKMENPLGGRKIRANALYRPIVEPLGGSMVNLSGGQIYAALQRGVVDGACWPILGAVNFKWYEVAKYMMRPRFGVSPYTVTMNLNRFNKLSKDDQKLLLDLGRTLEQKVPAQFNAATENEIKKLKELGVQETWIDEKIAAKMLADYNKGVWNLSMAGNKKTADEVMKLYELAKAAGDAPASLK
ncbi:MAG: TRAP transporter substrate-binding protein DctP [Rhodospirillaceae bacterium]|jgi:TRAP-type C4-dicarboxylate transport system substrate-binding protein